MEGQEVQVRVLEVNTRTGKMSLSMLPVEDDFSEYSRVDEHVLLWNIFLRPSREGEKGIGHNYPSILLLEQEDHLVLSVPCFCTNI